MTTVFGTLDHVLLMAPGPSPVAANVLEAMSLPTLGHLDPDCIKVMDALQEQLRAVCKTRNAVTFPFLFPALVLRAWKPALSIW